MLLIMPIQRVPRYTLLLKVCVKQLCCNFIHLSFSLGLVKAHRCGSCRSCKACISPCKSNGSDSCMSFHLLIFVKRVGQLFSERNSNCSVFLCTHHVSWQALNTGIRTAEKERTLLESSSQTSVLQVTVGCQLLVVVVVGLLIVCRLLIVDC